MDDQVATDRVRVGRAADLLEHGGRGWRWAGRTDEGGCQERCNDQDRVSESAFVGGLGFARLLPAFLESAG